MMQIYRPTRYYHGNGRGVVSDFLLAIPNHAVLSSEPLISESMLPKRYDKTGFENVKIIFVGYRTLPFDLKIFHPEGFQFNKERYAKIMLKAMEHAIFSAWEPEKFHLIPHSSGYDSRLIAIALKRLHEIHGDSWLGDIAFYEADGESEQAKQLLESEGWGDYPFYVYPGEEDCYHEPSFDMRTVWKRFNGISPYPVNVWYEPIEWLQTMPDIPSVDYKIQPITGFGSNEIATAFNRLWSIQTYFKWMYRHAISTFIHKGDWVHPFYDDFLLKTVNHNMRPRYRNSSLSKEVIEIISPESMEIQNLTVNDRNKTVKIISPSVIEKVQRDYKDTWYHDCVTGDIPPPPNIVDYDPFWAKWCMAGFCEHHLEEGYEVEAPK